MKTSTLPMLSAAVLAAGAISIASSCSRSQGESTTPQASSGQQATDPKSPASTTTVPKRSAEKARSAEEATVAPPKSAAKTAQAGGLSGDFNQWMGSLNKNNVRVAGSVPIDFDPGEIDEETGAWKEGTGKHVKWAAQVGSQTYGNPVIAGGKVFVGTNNGKGWVKHYPPDVDLGCLVCFDEKTGEFLWQHSNEKLKAGRVVDWLLQGVCSSAFVEGNRLWYVSNRGEVVCLDVDGFHDGENDGPVTDEKLHDKTDADVVWAFDMMKQLGTFQHNMCSCSVIVAGDHLFVNTSNGVDAGHINLPSPDAPTFLCMDKNTGKVLWTDKSPGTNILHGQWSSPAYAVLGGVPQVLFAGGDGWLRAFHAEKFADGKPQLLWAFDCNPKGSQWLLEGRGNRNNIIATPVVYQGLVYVAVGQDPEHGEGEGHLWCIDPTKRGDVSPTQVFSKDDLKTPLPHRRLIALEKDKGEVERANPNSAMVWHYAGVDTDGSGELEFEEQMHRSVGTVAIKDDVLYVTDFSGLVHCVDAKTGKPHWTYDMLAGSWGSPLIVDGKVFIGDEDGDVCVFRHSADPKVAMNDGAPIAEVNMGSAVYSTPVIANNTLFIGTRNLVYAIECGEPPNEQVRADGDSADANHQ